MQYIIGVDEAGRGPIAGPVAVGVVRIPISFATLPPAMGHTLRDSKKLSAKQREEIYTWITEHEEIEWGVGMSSNVYIDKHGIVSAIRDAMRKTLAKITGDAIGRVHVKLDGALRAPEEYKQETIIKGDEKVLAIALASIIAKVTRDRYMVKIARKYPGYGFEKHKGYGTKAHYVALAKLGISPLHRMTFCKQ